VPLADPRAESFAESWTRLEIRDHGLPAPTPQFWVELRGFGRVRLDLAYPRWKIAVEYNGEEFHSSPAQIEADLRRIEALRLAGWIVIVLTKEDLKRTAGAGWLATLAEAIIERDTPRRRVYSRGESSDFARRPR
jgi:very-short-patch-repair endonuclease